MNASTTYLDNIYRDNWKPAFMEELDRYNPIEKATQSTDYVNANVSANLSPNAANGTPQIQEALKYLVTSEEKAKQALLQAQQSGDQTAIQEAQKTVEYGQKLIQANLSGQADIYGMQAKKAAMAKKFMELCQKGISATSLGMEEHWNEFFLTLYGVITKSVFNTAKGFTTTAKIVSPYFRAISQALEISDGTAISVQEAQLRMLEGEYSRLEKALLPFINTTTNVFWTTLGGQSNQIFGSCAKIFGAGSSGGGGRGYYMA